MSISSSSMYTSIWHIHLDRPDLMVSGLASAIAFWVLENCTLLSRVLFLRTHKGQGHNVVSFCKDKATTWYPLLFMRTRSQRGILTRTRPLRDILIEFRLSFCHCTFGPWDLCSSFTILSLRTRKGQGHNVVSFQKDKATTWYPLLFIRTRSQRGILFTGTRPLRDIHIELTSCLSV